MREESAVPEKGKQGSLSLPEWVWLDRNVWTERMLAAAWYRALNCLNNICRIFSMRQIEKRNNTFCVLFYRI